MRNSTSTVSRSLRSPGFASQDVLVVGNALDETQSQSRKMEPDRMSAMLSRLGGRVFQVRQDQPIYGDERQDFDSDLDPDPDFDRDAKEHQSNLGGNPWQRV